MEIKNYIEENDNLPCTIVIVGDVEVNKEMDESLLNMFSDDTDYVEYMPEGIKEKLHGSSYMNLVYNNPDQKLYAYNKFVVKTPLNEEELEKLGEAVQGQWSDGIGSVFSQTPVMEHEGKEVYVSVWHKDQKAYLHQLPIELPKNHYWLGQIFKTPEEQMMYEEFLEDPIIYNRFVKMLRAKNIPFPEEATETIMLPIHKKDKNTGELLISTEVLKVFQQYQYCQNFLNDKEFPVGSPERDLGKIMMLVPKFCDYMMDYSKDKAEGKEIHNEIENYEKALLDAIKYLKKNKDLYYIYEKWDEEGDLKN